MDFVSTLLLWIFINIMIGITMQLSLFSQTTPAMENSGILAKILSSEFWASVQWMFAIPSQRIGYTFLSAPQLSLASYLVDFLSQILSNAYWLKLPTTIDDYVGMILIFFGMFSAKYTLFG